MDDPILLGRARKIFQYIMAVLTAIGWMATQTLAEEVVMTTGERFNTAKVWEENGKIRFSMNGLLVSVKKSDVAAIIGPQGRSRSMAHSGQQTISGIESPSAARTRPLSDDRPSTPTPQAASPHKEKQKSKTKGIGFSGISWQMRPADLPGLAKIDTDPAYGGIDQYWRPDEAMTLGDVLLDGLVFGFWQNRLYSIMLWVDGKSAYHNLKHAIFDRYGSAHKSKRHPHRHVWVDDKTTDRMLEFDQERNIGFFWMRSRELDRHIRKMYPES